MLQNKKGINFKKAFTLIELLVVVAIISLMSALVLNSIASARMRANDTKIAEDLRSFRKAAELYYNDNRVYPATDPSAMNNQNETVLAANNVQKSSWAHKLAFFVKTAEAAVTHNTPLCKNFDNAATAMVSRKYLATVPVHPYDNDLTGVCYKAVRSASGGTFSGYGELTTQVDINGPGGPSTMSKRSGFVTGDVSKDGIGELIAVTETLNSGLPANKKEIVYPAGLDGGNPFGTFSDLATVDSVDGITSGISVSSCGSGQLYDPITRSCRTLFTGTRNNSATCPLPQTQSLFTDNCVGTDGAAIANCPSGQIRDIDTGVCTCEHGFDTSGSCIVLVPGMLGSQNCPTGYVATSAGVCVSDGTLPGSCELGGANTATGICYTISPGCSGSYWYGACANPSNPGTYTCPSGKMFVVNGSQGTANGTCVATPPCTDGKVYNINTGLCECPAGSQWINAFGSYQCITFTLAW